MASVEVACPQATGQVVGAAEQVSSCLSGSSDASCLTSSKNGSASPRSSAEGASELKMEAVEEANLEGLSSATNEASLLPSVGYLGEVVFPEGFDDSAVDGGQLSDAEKWADVLDCTPEDILNFSYEDIAGPINQISLPEPSIISASFADDPMPENDLGEVMDWESLSLPDIYDMCPAAMPAPPPRGPSNRKANLMKEAIQPLVLGPVPMKARSKRVRGVKTSWASDFLSGLMEPMKRARHASAGEGWDKLTASPTLSAGSTGTVVSCSNELSAGQVESALVEQHGLSFNGVLSSGNRRGSPFTETGAIRRCSHCSTTKTPQWRAGPNGPKTLCNACGVRYKSGRLCAEYRPASSPEFESDKHSNSHRKIVEMRKVKEHGVPEGVASQVAVARPPVAQRRVKKTALQPRKPHMKPRRVQGEDISTGAATESLVQSPTSGVSDGGSIPGKGTSEGVIEAAPTEPGSPSDQPISKMSLPAASLGPRTQPFSKISVRVFTDRNETAASCLAVTGSSSCLVELGSPTAGDTLSELFKSEKPSVKSQISAPADSSAPGVDDNGSPTESPKKMVEAGQGQHEAASGQMCPSASDGSLSSGASSGASSVTAPVTPVSGPSKVEPNANAGLQSRTETPPTLPNQPHNQSMQTKVQPIEQHTAGAHRPQDPKVMVSQRQQHLMKLQRQKQARRQQKQARQQQQQQQQHHHRYQAQHHQQHHQAVQQQHIPVSRQMMYYSHPPMAYPQGLPHVQFMPHQPHYPYQQQLLLQQQHLPPQSLQQQHMMMQRQHMQQQQVQDVPPSQLAEQKAENMEIAKFPSSPVVQKVIPCAIVSPGALSAKKQDLASKTEEQQRDTSSESKWELARPPALSPVGQSKPSGDQERLREQLRRRQEMGQSIRRQLDTAPKGDQDSDAAAETLPISVAFGHSSPGKVVPKVLRPPPPAANAVRKIGPHLFRRSAVPVKLPISSAVVQPQPVVLQPEPKMEAPWEDLGSDRIFVRGSVGVEA